MPRGKDRFLVQEVHFRASCSRHDEVIKFEQFGQGEVQVRGQLRVPHALKPPSVQNQRVWSGLRGLAKEVRKPCARSSSSSSARSRCKCEIGILFPMFENPPVPKISEFGYV